jgi:Holliday junction resolvase RusA-like endonuclease
VKRSVKVTLWGDPIAKGRPKISARVVFQNGKHRAIVTARTPDETRKAEAAIAEAVRQVMAGQPPLDGPLALSFLAVFEAPPSWPKAAKAAADAGELYHVGKPDQDNVEKLALDAMNEIAFWDDAQIADKQSRKRYGLPARVEITLREVVSPKADVTHVPQTPVDKRREERKHELSVRAGKAAPQPVKRSGRAVLDNVPRLI